jgi:ribose 5-phosphate isomerase A
LSKSSAQLESEKRLAAETVARWVSPGARIGLGSGTTAAYFIRALGRRVRDEKLRVSGIATSQASEAMARAESIPLVEPQRRLILDFTVDGADELTPELHLIKGGGGKLFREKVIASASKFLVIIADSTKPVDQLGRMPLPVEVVPFAFPWVMDRIVLLGAKPVLRVTNGATVITDQGNWIVDCHFHSIPDPYSLASKLDAVPGILEHGLFLGLAKLAVVADGERVSLLRVNGSREDAAQFSDLPRL